MSFKLLTPFAGVSGTIACVSGVSISGPHAKERASTDPYHTWKLQDTVSIGDAMNCWLDEKYERAEEKRSLLQVESGVEASIGEELIKKGEVDVNVELNFWVIGSSGQLAELEKVAGEEVLTDIQYWKEGRLK